MSLNKAPRTCLKRNILEAERPEHEMHIKMDGLCTREAVCEAVLQAFSGKPERQTLGRMNGFIA